jgi:hypothetical protein
MTLFWSMYLLACAPSEQDWIAEEVRSINLAADSAGEPLEKLPSTRAGRRAA